MPSLISTYRLIRSLRPIDVIDIVTQGTCRDYLPKITKEIIEVRGEWFVNNWPTSTCKIDLLSFYISDGGFTLYNSKSEAIRLKAEFLKIGSNYDVGYNWYSGDDDYKVGLSYTYEHFDKLYSIWLREKNLDKILE